MTWDVAKALDVLLWQVNTMAPGRSKRSDGSIGDLDHQGQTSEHNPENKPFPEPDEVDARDITHDPAAGADMGVIAEQIRISRDRRVLYAIWHDQMFSSYPKAGWPAWTWRPYSGDYHTHLHVSLNDVDDDNPALWKIGPWATGAGSEDEMKPVLCNLRGRASVFYKEDGKQLRPISDPDTFKLLSAVSTIVTGDTATAIVDAFGPLAGMSVATSVQFIHRAG